MNDNNSMLGLQWSAPTQSEILVKVVLGHGDSDVFATQTLRFTDGATGIENAQLAIDALPHLSALLPDTWKFEDVDLEDEDVRDRVFAYATEEDIKACVVVAKRLNVPLKKLYQILSPVIVMDLKYGQYASIVGMAVEHRTPEGTRRAVFSSSEGGTVQHHFKALKDISAQSLARQLGD
jgi:hypothetical protein